MAFDVLGDYSKFEKRYEGLLDNITFNHPFNVLYFLLVFIFLVFDGI